MKQSIFSGNEVIYYLENLLRKSSGTVKFPVRRFTSFSDCWKMVISETVNPIHSDVPSLSKSWLWIISLASLTCHNICSTVLSTSFSPTSWKNLWSATMVRSQIFLWNCLLLVRIPLLFFFFVGTGWLNPRKLADPHICKFLYCVPSYQSCKALPKDVQVPWFLSHGLQKVDCILEKHRAVEVAIENKTTGRAIVFLKHITRSQMKVERAQRYFHGYIVFAEDCDVQPVELFRYNGLVLYLFIKKAQRDVGAQGLYKKLVIAAVNGPIRSWG